jgi:opacity protein-like surface antigen
MKQQHVMLNAVLGSLTLLFAANLAIAEGFSIGVSATRASVDVQDVGIDIDGDADGYRFFGAYMFNEKYGVEVGLSAFGEPNDSTIPSDMHVETTNYDVFGVASYPLSPNFSLIGKAGVAYSVTETEVGDDDDTETRHSSTDLALGFGGEYEFTERFAIRGDVEWVDSKDAGAANMISLGGVWRFK